MSVINDDLRAVCASETLHTTRYRADVVQLFQDALKRETCQPQHRNQRQYIAGVEFPRYSRPHLAAPPGTGNIQDKLSARRRPCPDERLNRLLRIA